MFWESKSYDTHIHLMILGTRNNHYYMNHSSGLQLLILFYFKTGLFKSSFSWGVGVNLTSFMFQEELINISITYTTVKQPT